MRLKEAYEGWDITFKERNPGMAFVSRPDIFVAFRIVERSDFPSIMLGCPLPLVTRRPGCSSVEATFL